MDQGAAALARIVISTPYSAYFPTLTIMTCLFTCTRTQKRAGSTSLIKGHSIEMLAAARHRFENADEWVFGSCVVTFMHLVISLTGILSVRLKWLFRWHYCPRIVEQVKEAASLDRFI